MDAAALAFGDVDEQLTFEAQLLGAVAGRTEREEDQQLARNA